MPDAIQVGDKWYISASTSRSDERAQVLKHNETFAVVDRFGDMRAFGTGGEGLYHDDTRFLSHQQLLIDGLRPLFLNANLKEDNSLLVVELMNPDLAVDGGAGIPKGTIHLFRAKLLWNSACYEHVRVSNYGLTPVKITLEIRFAADYFDIFQVRGVKRTRSGELLPPRVGSAELLLGYRGLDGIARHTRIRFDPPPHALDGKRALFELTLPPREEGHLYCTLSCELEGAPQPGLVTYNTALQYSSGSRHSDTDGHCRVETSNALFNLWLDRSLSDLAMLTTALPEGPYPYAGVPWYSTTFGRDGILTARELLWIDARLAKGVLSFLAATQASEVEPRRDAEPGKILHEARKGEMANLGEVPFGHYYGTVDATPLFVGLAGAYYARTGDAGLIRSIWPNIRRALEWIDHYGDSDGDGFVEYARRSKEGLTQQGWKDSWDSVFHEDGTIATPPIALCEVQGYVYEAKLLGAGLADLVGEAALASRLRGDAQALKKKFHDTFWCEQIHSYAIALDGAKHQCCVRSSNAGQLLWSGIVPEPYAGRLVEDLVGPDFFTGWGIRTIATGQSRYNPMSYHNGSVWPHDNALIAAGMGRYGYTAHASKILSGLFDASLEFDQHRLPELFCGFPRRPAEGPTLYPVACSPQAWASAAVFMLIQACLGLELRLDNPQVSFHAPRLPDSLQWMKIRNIAVGDARVDVLLQRYANNVGIDVIRKHGSVEVVAAM
jgi:glycogen debranching enzyme